MSETKHTPGPWKWTEVWATRSSNDWPTFVRLDGGDNQCVFVQDGPVRMSPADARLIAAAPEMYDLLIRLNDGLDEYWVTTEEGREANAKLGAIIARIEQSTGQAEQREKTR